MTFESQRIRDESAPADHRFVPGIVGRVELRGGGVAEAGLSDVRVGSVNSLLIDRMGKKKLLEFAGLRRLRGERLGKKKIHSAGPPGTARKLVEIVERSLIGFGLVIAAEFEHRETASKICDNRAELRIVRSRRSERERSQRLKTVLLRHVTRGMAMVRVRGFMRKHSGERGFVIDKTEQPSININPARRNRKGIHRFWIVDDRHRIMEVLVLDVR